MTVYETVLLSDREAALLEQQDGTPVGMRGVPWAVERPAAAGTVFQPELSRAKILTCGEAEEGQIDPATFEEGPDVVSVPMGGNEKLTPRDDPRAVVSQRRE